MIKRSFTVTFPFIEKKLTANQTKGKNKYLIHDIKKDLQEKCAIYIDEQKVKQKLFKCYYGALMHRYWFFADNRTRDVDNFAAGTKYYIDTFVDRKVIKKDDSKHLMIGDTIFIMQNEKESLRFVFQLFESKKDFDMYQERRIENVI